MSALNNFISHTVTPKSTRRRPVLGMKKPQRQVKRGAYESPLRLIRIGNKIWKDRQSKLSHNGKGGSNKTSNTFVSEGIECLEDSVIILSDNECESNNKTEKNKCKKQPCTRKRPLEESKEGKQHSDDSRASNSKSTERKTRDEPCPNKKRKRSIIVLPDNNSSCLLISDTEESEISTVDLVDENIAPISGSTKQALDDIVVVWSSTEDSQSTTGQTINNITDKEKDIRLFMIDCSPNPKNLGCLTPNEQIGSELGKKDVREVNSENPNFLPFSQRGLKFPKACNISKNIVIKKPQTRVNRIRNFGRHRVSKTSALNAVPIACSSRTVQEASEAFNEPPNSQTTSSIIDQAASDKSQPSNKLREIVIDGNNIAMAYKKGRGFSEEGLMLVINYFRQRGHTVKVFVPQHRRSQQHKFLEKLYTDGIVVFTPSRSIGGKWIVPYDDRYILEYATMCGGIVVSLDQFRDLYMEKPEWRDTIENRLLAPTFVGGYVMFPEDPLGRKGPKLAEFLRH